MPPTSFAKRFTSIGEKSFFLILLFEGGAWAQEPIGLMNDNYMPASAAMYNPASPLTSPIPGDINLISADALASNNIAYSDQFSLLTLHSNMSNGSVAYNTPNTIRAFSKVTIQAPSVVFRQNSFSWGIITQIRSAASLVTQHVSPDLDFNNIIPDTVYQFPASKTAGMNWMGIGLNVGKNVINMGTNRFYVAVNVNYLAGWDAISAFTQQPLYFVKNSEAKTMSFSDVVMNYGYTSGFSSDVSRNLTSFKFKGSGAGMDAGVWFTHGHDPADYKWKVGVSVIDMGFISFNKNVQHYSMTTDTTVTATMSDFSSITSADAFTQLASQMTAGKGSLKPISGPLTVWLPAAFAFQGEVALPNHFFIHSLVVQQIIVSQQQVLRPNSVVLTPRYETKMWAAGLPIDWYDYQHLQLGGYVRVGPVVAGSDNLAALLIPSKWEGADFYIGVHMPLTKSRNNQHSKAGGIGCPRF